MCEELTEPIIGCDSAVNSQSRRVCTLAAAERRPTLLQGESLLPCLSTVPPWCAAFVVMGLVTAGLAQAGDLEAGSAVAVDTEHIFGFAEGADIGEAGERELEITTTGLLGKLGRYAGFQNETALRYGVAEGFRASLGGLTDYHAVSGVPGLIDVHALNVSSGISSEFRWQLLNRSSAPVDLTVSFEPLWQRIDDVSGRSTQAHIFPVRLLLDVPLASETAFVAFNLAYAPTFVRGAGLWQLQNPIEISLAASAAITRNSFLGLEVRQSALDQHGFFSERAVFLGPSLFVRLSEAMVFKIAGEAQIPVETNGRYDLVNYERFELRGQFALTF